MNASGTEWVLFPAQETVIVIVFYNCLWPSQLSRPSRYRYINKKNRITLLSIVCNDSLACASDSLQILEEIFLSLQRAIKWEENVWAKTLKVTIIDVRCSLIC